MRLLAGSAGKSPDDDFWFEAFRNGDEQAGKEAVKTIFQVYQRPLISYARRWVRQDEAEDIFMEAVERAWDRRTSFKSVNHLVGFLRLVEKNACIDSLRRRRFIDGDVRKLQELESSAADGESAMELELRWISLLDRLNLKMEELSTEEQLILNKHFFEGKTLTKIAAEMQINRNTLYSTKSRLRQKLRRLLGDDWQLFVLLFMAKHLL